jgi:hypothetical protein
MGLVDRTHGGCRGKGSSCAPAVRWDSGPYRRSRLSPVAMRRIRAQTRALLRTSGKWVAEGFVGA